MPTVSHVGRGKGGRSLGHADHLLLPCSVSEALTCCTRIDRNGCEDQNRDHLPVSSTAVLVFHFTCEGAHNLRAT